MTDKTMTIEQAAEYGWKHASWDLENVLMGVRERHLSQPAERGHAVAEVVIGATRCYSDDEWYREVTAAGICFLAPLDQQDAAISLIGRGIKPRTTPPPAAGVPDGWRLVPIEPTEEMLDAATMHDTTPRDASTDQWNRDTWSFMLDAAPEATPSPTIDMATVRELIKDWRVMARITGNKYERESLAMCADKLARAIEDAK